MIKRLILTAILAVNFYWIQASKTELLINTYNRTSTSLNGDWKYIVDPYENGYYNYRYEPFDQQEFPWRDAFFLNSKQEDSTQLLEYNFDLMTEIRVPGDWNTQKDELFYYEGTVWYKKSFDYELTEDNRLFIYFGASNYKTEVYFNGKKLGTHLGGFTPFNYEVTDLITQKENFVVVKVDNKRHKDAVPTLNTDWWNYGGITRDVKLIETSKNFIQDYFIQLDPENNKKIKGSITLNGDQVANKKITVSIPELSINYQTTTDQNGVAEVEFKAKDINYWSTENPFLYDVTLQTSEDTLVDQIGFRSITTKGHQILLNSKPIFLKGICIHEEQPFGGGRANNLEHAKTLLGWAKELGCNYVRLAHYQHNEHMLRLADQMGILVWEENPVYWTISWENEATYNNAKNQLEDMIARDKNRASVIIWSMANETPVTEARNTFLTNLANYTRSVDPTRLISAALEKSDYKGNKNIKTIDDPYADVVDVLSFNQYLGWYDGLPDKCSTVSWKFEQDKPVLISEFGGGARFGYHGNENIRWTEEFQARLFRENLKMIDQIEKLQGFSPWVLVDFRSPRRLLAGIQDKYNRKGLISDQGEKKQAFYVLQEYYSNK